MSSLEGVDPIDYMISDQRLKLGKDHLKAEIKGREQKLIDITFELVMTMKNSQRLKNHATREELMAWVADQLRKCDFDTEPIGASWGVLK